MTRIPFVLICISFVAGCAATGGRFQTLEQVAPASAEILVFRPDRFVRGGVAYQVHLDGREVGTLKNAGFLSLRTVPGNHVLEVKAGLMQASFKDIRTEVALASGQRHIYRFEPITSGPIIPAFAYVSVAFRFEIVTEDAAVQELRDLKQSD